MKNYAIVFLISISSVSFASWQPVGSDINGEAAGDLSGRSVALSAGGTTVAIGAEANDGNGDQAGQVRVYNIVFGQGTSIADSSWVQVGNDIIGEAAGDGFGFRVAISSDGTIFAGAAPNGTNGNGEPSGYVSVYEYDGIDWIQLGSDIDGDAAGERFGESLTISGDGTRVVIGAPWNNNFTGDVRVYEYDGIDWTQLGSDIVGEATGDSNGWSVDISEDGSIIVIGAKGNDGNGNSAGHARVFEFDPATADWTQLGSDIDGEAAGDGSGRSVAISSDNPPDLFVAIGAIGNDGNGNSAGHVRVYEYDGIDWIQLGSDIDGDAARDFSGLSVSLSADGPPLGTIVAIGATGNDGNGNNAGHARVYQYDPTTADWVQRGSDIDGDAADDNFGVSVHLNNGGTVVAIGATGNDNNAGHARVMHTLPDSDGDGLVDYDEVNAYGTATNNIDTDGDGWSDYFEVNLSYTFSATNNDSAIISSNSTVSSELEAAALLLTTNQAYAMLDDAYTEDIVMSVSNDIADIVMTLEQSTNLTVGAWTTNKFLTNSVPVDADAKFFRFRLAE
mgnify:CR=1 FL=1